MADIKISAAASAGTLLSTDMVPVARSGDTSAYHGTMSQVATFVASVAGGVTSWNTRTGAVTLTTADVTTALTYTPYNTTNPAGYQTAADVTTTLVPYAPLASPTFTGTPTLPTGAVAVTQTKGNNTTALATTAFVLANAGAGGASISVSDTAPGSPTNGALWWASDIGQLFIYYTDINSSQWVVANNGGVTPPVASSTTPSMDGTAAVGTGTTYARADHVHPSDTSRAPTASPTFTGTVTTAALTSAGTVSGAGFTTLLAPYAPLAAPVFTGDARAVTPAVGDNDTSIATTAFVQAAVAPAFNDVGRNLLHNPLFNVQQRGVGPWTSLSYTADRWHFYVNLDTASVAMQAFTLGSMSFDDAARWALGNTFTGNAGAAAQTVVYQAIEDVTRLSGKTVTVSFYATAASGAPRLGVNLDQNFGTGGSPSAQVRVTGQAVTLSTAWARYSLTFTLPAISGKTLGTNGDSATSLNIFYSTGSTLAPISGIGVQSGTIQLWGMQLEIGTQATPLEKPDPQQDLAKCQRFFLTGQYNWAGYTGNNPIGGTLSFPPMRAAPTIVLSGQTYNNASAATASTITPSSAQFNASGSAAGTAWFGTAFTASADL